MLAVAVRNERVATVIVKQERERFKAVQNNKPATQHHSSVVTAQFCEHQKPNDFTESTTFNV